MSLRKHRNGFVLVAAALTLVMLIGMLGLTTDLARMYIARNELQAYADSAAIAAALELNGTSEGISHARNTATNYPNKWNFANHAPQTVTVEFAETAAGPWVASPADPKEVQYVRVYAHASVTLYFMPGFSATAPAAMLFTIARQRTIEATAASGQFLVSGFNDGLIPYSPDSIDPSDPNFGFVPGRMYTLRWPPKGQRDKSNNWCDGDEAANFITPSDANDRGFIDIAGNGSSDIRDAIINNKQTRPLYVGDTIQTRSGNRGTESDAMRYRINQDTDNTSWTWAEYVARLNDETAASKGNFRRFVIVPINNPANDEVIGFGGFFLHPDVCSNGGDTLLGNNGGGNGGNNVATCCAEYVGAATLPGRPAGGSDAKAYQVKILK